LPKLPRRVKAAAAAVPPRAKDVAAIGLPFRRRLALVSRAMTRLGTIRHAMRRGPRALRVALITLAVLILAPYVIAPFYRFGHPVSTVMLWRWMTGQRVERVFVPLSQVSPLLIRSVLVAEDGRFCEHHGVDFTELGNAISEADDLADMRGGSTITQQLAKNLFLWPGRSYVRKALEFPLALWIDLVLPKRRILELYLNVAEWGPDGVFGAEAGSRRAFGRPVQHLSAYQAALLAAALPNPVERDPKRPGRGLRQLAGLYVARAARVPEVASCVRPTP
jgi:monofunctional biosynthetic peptidoglycan transglycosylase